MRVIWDPEKAKLNVAKHRISFDVAKRVWDDPLATILPDRVVDGEQRWHIVGITGALVVPVVVHIYPDEDDDTVVRIIGARKATSHERRRYEE